MSTEGGKKVEVFFEEEGVKILNHRKDCKKIIEADPRNIDQPPIKEK